MTQNYATRTQHGVMIAFTPHITFDLLNHLKLKFMKSNLKLSHAAQTKGKCGKPNCNCENCNCGSSCTCKDCKQPFD